MIAHGPLNAHVRIVYMRFGYPSEVRVALAQILEIACLSIRVAARQGDSKYCAVEANHVHNIPGLLRKFDGAKLKYYLTVTRPQYIEDLQRCPSASAEPYKALWAELERYAD